MPVFFRNIVGTLVVLSFSITASAQTTAPKPKPAAKKPPVATKQAPTTPPPNVAPVPPPPPTDVQVRTKYIIGAQVSENSTYVQGGRQRFEFPGVSMLTQCDLNRSVLLNSTAKRYLVLSAPSPAQPPATPNAPPADDLAAQAAAMSTGARADASKKPKGGVITETVTLIDTGERKQMFGLEARHIKTAVVRQPGENACDAAVITVETDGWYADLPLSASCPIVPATLAAPSGGQPSCTDHVTSRTVGDAKLGFALSTIVTTTIVDAKAKDKEKDKEVSTTAMEVTDLKVTSLDAALFEVPADFTEVKDYKSLLPSVAAGGSVSDAVFGSTSSGTSTVAPKNPGVIRVGLVTPTNKTDRELPDLRLVGSLLAGFTKAPFQGVSVSDGTIVDVDRDCAAKACDYILVSDIAEIKTSKPNKVGGLLRRVSRDANAPVEIHEVRVDYKLYAVGDPVTPRVTASAKASSGGGFGVGSVLRLAAFAGEMYLTMGMGSGMFMGMLGPGAFPGSGGMTTDRINPGLSAAVSIVSTAAAMDAAGEAASSSDAAGTKIAETVQDALARAAKQVADDLRKGAATKK
jgi:hypothetical protein